MMLFMIASVFIYGASAARQFKCSTDHFIGTANEMSLEYGSHSNPYTWNGAEVPYYFSDWVTYQDKMFVKKQMKIIESKTCVRFIEHPEYPIPEHHLQIDIRHGSCASGFSGYVSPNHYPKIIFGSDLQFTDQPFCGGDNSLWSGGVIHELFHALGAIHTHEREDRDRYVTYNKTCLKDPSDDDQFQKTGWNLPTKNIPYDFKSVMHYECDTMSWCEHRGCCNTLQPKDGTSCSVVGSNQPTELDWEIIRQYQCGGDSGTSSSTTAKTTTTTTSSFGPTDLYDSQTCARWKEWGVCREDICAATCGGDSATSSATTTTTTTTTTTSSFGPSDIEDWETCALYKNLGWCGEHADIRNRCAATCNEDSGTSSSTTTTSCNYEDIYDWQSCAEYKTQGWCWIDDYWCAATCNC